jgi:hypothetical protein
LHDCPIFDLAKGRLPHAKVECDLRATCSDDVRFPPDDLSELFSHRAEALDGVAYEVDATLVSGTVVLRYDPSRPRE